MTHSAFFFAYFFPLGLFGVSENSTFPDTLRVHFVHPTENPPLGLFGVSENSTFPDTLRVHFVHPSENPLLAKEKSRFARGK